MKCVIMAGGMGTRISSVAGDIPKPMIKIGGRPVLEYAIRALEEQGIKDIIITVGHLASAIIDYFGNGEAFGLHIDYYVEEQPLGNAGALFLLRDMLTDDFILINGDCIFDVDLRRFISYHKEKGGSATLFTHPNSHPYDSGIVVADHAGIVTKWLTKEDIRPKYYKNRVNAGIHILSRKVLDMRVQGKKADLDRDILKPLAGTGNMYAYDSPEYVKDMGTVERYQAVCKDLKCQKIKCRNLGHRQKAIFLDRDGTINKYVGFLTNLDEFELLPGAGEAVKRLNDSEYLAIVVTNQPVIARGEVSLEELEMIHDKMETLLGQQGAYLDKIYFCPHHPDGGYSGERPEYKKICGCRKPEPGMLIRAAKEFNIDLSESWMIGDSESDILTGKAAGCKTALIGKAAGTSPDICVDSLYGFTERILDGLQII